MDVGRWGGLGIEFLGIDHGVSSYVGNTIPSGAALRISTNPGVNEVFFSLRD